jgi:hypothetical protein
MITLNVPSHVNTAKARNAPIAMVQAAQKNPGTGKHTGPKANGPKMGSWLQAHKNLPPDQQLKLLENDPGFKKLSPERQAALRERLQKFNSLPPEKKDQALERMEFLSKLSPQQRQQLRDANRQLQGLPQERQVMVHKALRHLRQMPPDERKQVLESERFHSTFSDQEQKLIGELAEINPQAASAQNQQSK